VVKNHPFVLIINSTVNLRQTKIETNLCYDFKEGEERKLVDFVRVPPIKATVHLDSRGTRATIETKISALSSQHEDSPFRVLITVTNMDSGNQLEVVSHPVRVVSKPTFNKYPSKKLLKRKIPSTTLVPEREEILRRDKRTTSIDLSNIEEVHVLRKDNNPTDDFEEIFRTLVASYNKLSPEDRPTKVRKLVKNFGSTNGFIDLLVSESNNQNNSDQLSPSNCNSYLDINTLYADLFSDEFVHDTNSMIKDTLSIY